MASGNSLQVAGSPPHTWRKLLDGIQLNNIFRITSTYVEKIANAPVKVSKFSGSPPHTWRKLNTLLDDANLSRITSTYVEKITEKGDGERPVEDHLHIRGENTNNSVFGYLISGSPPHTWRKSSQDYREEMDVRITSTYVEKILKDP